MIGLLIGFPLLWLLLKLVEWLEDGARELYNLETDLSEKIDLADEQTVRAREMSDRLHAWLKLVDAKMPTAP